MSAGRPWETGEREIISVPELRAALVLRNTRCERCGLSLGYLPGGKRFPRSNRMAAPTIRSHFGARLPTWNFTALRQCRLRCLQLAIPAARRTAIARHAGITVSFPTCRCRRISLGGVAGSLETPAFYTLFQLRLPVETQAENPAGLAFRS
jgi:hypothetical protein